MKWWKGAASAFVLFLVPAAHAQEIPGDPKADNFYAGIHGGAVILQDSDLTGNGLSGVELEFDTGFGIGAFLGYKFKNAIRVEGEYTFRRNGVDDFTVGGVSASGAGLGIDGDVDAHSFMGNVWWEPRVGGNWLPYLGGGVGVSIIKADVTASIPGFGTLSEDESDTVFTYQAGAGVGYAVTDRVVVSADYRFLGTSDPSFGVTEAEYRTHNFMVGVRGHF